MGRAKPLTKQERKARQDAFSRDLTLIDGWRPDSDKVEKMMIALGIDDRAATARLTDLMPEIKATYLRGLQQAHSPAPALGSIQATAGEYAATVREIMKRVEGLAGYLNSLPPGLVDRLPIIITRSAENASVPLGAVVTALLHSVANGLETADKDKERAKHAKTARRLAGEHAAAKLLLFVDRDAPNKTKTRKKSWRGFVHLALQEMSIPHPSPDDEATDWKKFLVAALALIPPMDWGVSAGTK